MFRPGDDKVIVHIQAQRCGSCGDLFCNGNVVFTWRWVAARMVVDEDDGGSAQIERALYHLARVNGRMVDRAGLLDLVGNQRMLVVEEQHAELLDLTMA